MRIDPTLLKSNSLLRPSPVRNFVSNGAGTDDSLPKKCGPAEAEARSGV